MRLRTVAATVVWLAAAGVVGTASASSASTVLPLTLPQGSAFSVLGHSCGGIQEQSVARGFDAATGFPDGYVYIRTSCGGSGRGGGYHTTAYTAWTAASWDFTGALISFSVVSAPPSSVDPHATATDANGNEVYTSISSADPTTCTLTNTTSCHYSAFLSWSPTFVPAPRVLGITGTVGPTSGGTLVTITGTGLTAATGVSFGTVAATSFSVVSDTALTAVAPAAPSGTVDVTVASPGGASAPTTADLFVFVAPPTVVGVAPRAGSASGGYTVTVTGANLSRVTGVQLGETAAGFSVLSDTALSVYVPGTDEPGSVHVTVASPGGASTPTASDQFVYAPSSCSVKGTCQGSAHCAKLTGTLKGAMTVNGCSPSSKLSSTGAFTLAGHVTWSTGGRTTLAYFSPPVSLGRGSCPRGSTEHDLYGAVIGGTTSYTSFGDSVFARTCATASKKLSLVAGTKFLL